MNLALGTVQFGLNYGISNTKGQVDKSTAEQILLLAKQNNINTLDTAADYGESETVIGELSYKNNSTFNIVTKISSSACNRYENITTTFEDEIKSSLSKLNTRSVYAVLLHNTQSLLSDNGSLVYNALVGLKNNKFCQKIGVSVYSPEELNYVLDHFDIDLVQLPLNILDQRFSHPKIIEKLQKNNIEVHARSLFLQGLLLMPSNKMPDYFAVYQKHFLALNTFIEQHKINNLAACLSFAKSMTFVDKFVIGVNSFEELSEIITTYKQVVALDFCKFSNNDKKLIIPANWPT